ncbi:unnamed protein product [Withania somnifera]
MAKRKKTNPNLVLFIILFFWLVLAGQSVMGWASPMTRGGTKLKKLVDQRYEGIFFEDNNIKAKEDYGGDENGFDYFYRQHEDIPSPGVGN